MRPHVSRVFLMMGNDDCAANLDVLKKNDPGLFRLIHGKRIKLTEEFDIVGYSFVPITPFGAKDWEKYDFSEAPTNLLEEYEEIKRTNYKLSGVKSTTSGWERFQFTPEMEKTDSLQRDLFHDSFLKDADKTVYVIHAPPYKTNLDQVYNGFGDEAVHLGSMAVRLFIERYQPLLTLHGHIHETVELSGDYKQEIGKTLCLSAGNSNIKSQLAVLVFDLYDPRNVSRELI